ncbi:MAG: putative sugar nucleotidyl transferase [candidate division WOR-3 bacterium]|nr:putative sugar nucleotidyl transferase [candidate division WOR-3 bacterium]
MLYIYEDEYYQHFLPLVYFRSVADLFCGRFTLLEKYQRFYSEEKIGLLVRPILKPLLKEKYPELVINEFVSDDTMSLFLSSRAILKMRINISGDEEIFTNPQNEIIGFRVKNFRVKQIPINTKTIRKLKLPHREIPAISINYPWDLIVNNYQELINDFSNSAVLGKISEQAIIFGNPDKLYVGSGAEIEAGAVIDLRDGPVFIDEGAKILALSRINGPVYIGKNTIVDQGKISNGTTIGENCRVSGEIEASILQGFVNKHHYGFLGHSYLAEWVNLGAGTTNSDLKNNYSTVKVKIGKKTIDTQQLKVGCFIGDHTKIAIGVMIPTGAVWGILANVLTPAKSIPNFYWSEGKRWQLKKALTTVKIAMARRNIALSKNYAQLIQKLYKA